MEFRTREATHDDAALIEEALLLAVNWDPSRPPLSIDAARREPSIAHYVEGWPRPSDAGVVAEQSTGTPLGAAWWRFFPWTDPGYGFVDPAVPEVSIGVRASARGHGVGRALLVALHRLASARGIARLSLSVEKANRAAELYRQLGYREVADDGQAWTMALDLSST